MENPSYYSVTPASVRYDDRLSANAKLLYGEITALCNKNGYCHAKNKYFAVLYKVGVNTVSEWIRQLIDAGHITSEIASESGNSRKLFIVGGCDVLATRDKQPADPEGGYHEKLEGVSRKIGRGYHEKLEEGYHEKLEDYNTTSAEYSEEGIEEAPLLIKFSPLTPYQIAEQWNAYVVITEGNLLRCSGMTGERRRHATARGKEKYFLEHWTEAIIKVAQSDFCKGANDRGWKGNIDWFMRPGIVQRIMEGHYDNRETTTTKRKVLTNEDYEREETKN